VADHLGMERNFEIVFMTLLKNCIS